MTVSMTIRNIPDEVRDDLSAKASRKGHSLQEYVHKLLVEEASKPDIGDLIKQIRSRKQILNTQLSSDVILEHLKGDRK